MFTREVEMVRDVPEVVEVTAERRARRDRHVERQERLTVVVGGAQAHLVERVPCSGCVEVGRGVMNGETHASGYSARASSGSQSPKRPSSRHVLDSYRSISTATPPGLVRGVRCRDVRAWTHAPPSERHEHEVRSVTRRSALVVGAGIGGLSAAIALGNSGWTVRVLERRARSVATGAGLTLAANAMRALGELGVAAAVREVGTPFTLGALRRADGRVLMDADASMPQGVAVRRSDLHDVLQDAVPPGSVTWSASVDAFEPTPEGVSVRLGDGRTIEGELLVVADGLRSRLRRSMYGSEPLRYAGSTVWRALVPFDVGSLSSETWGCGRRFGIVPLRDGWAYVFAVEVTPSGGRDAEGGRRALIERFADWHDPIAELIHAVDDDAVMRDDLYDRPPLRTPWGQGRVTMLGDAAHPTTPNLGQGAAQAMESAVMLGRVLQERPDDVVFALRRYEAMRAPRTAMITRTSARFGWLAQRSSPVACRLRDALLQRTPSPWRERQLAAILGYDVTTDRIRP